MQNSKKEIFLIAIKLLIICTIVAGIVALVNTITKDRIELNNKKSTAEALSSIYGTEFKVSGEKFSFDGGNCTSVTNTKFQCEDVTALYVLTDNQDNVTGYCVAIQPMGFKDVVKMLVAVNVDLSIKSVKVVSMSETSGFGTRVVDEPWFLEQFTKSDVEPSIIAGATKTSKPVIDAVSNAVKEVEYYKNANGGNVQ